MPDPDRLLDRNSNRPPQSIALRPEVRWFAEQMELQLRANDHKGGWQNDHHQTLIGRLQEETAELQRGGMANCRLKASAPIDRQRSSGRCQFRDDGGR